MADTEPPHPPHAAGGPESLDGATPSEGPTAAGLLRPLLDEQVVAALAVDGALPHDLHSGTHTAYVTFRRLRTTLTVCRPLLDGAVGAANVELRWFLDELRPLHDVDLVRQRLAAAIAPGSDPEPGSDPLPERLLGNVRRDALRLATQAWTSERFLDLSRALGQLFGSNVIGPSAQANADEVFQQLLATEVRRLRTRAEQAQVTGAGDRDQRLHDLRSAARRVRYAGTLLGHVEAATAARVQRHLKTLLRVLRDRHDSTVTRDCLEQVLREGRLDPGSAAVASRVARQEEVTTSRLDRKLPRHISRAIALDTVLVRD